MTDPFKFNKDIYWARRQAGLHGQVHPEHSKEQSYDNRVMMKKIRADEAIKLKKGKKHEKPKRQVVSPPVQ